LLFWDWSFPSGAMPMGWEGDWQLLSGCELSNQTRGLYHGWEGYEQLNLC